MLWCDNDGSGCNLWGPTAWHSGRDRRSLPVLRGRLYSVYDCCHSTCAGDCRSGLFGGTWGVALGAPVYPAAGPSGPALQHLCTTAFMLASFGCVSARVHAWGQWAPRWPAAGRPGPAGRLWPRSLQRPLVLLVGVVVRASLWFRLGRAVRVGGLLDDMLAVRRLRLAHLCFTTSGDGLSSQVPVDVGAPSLAPCQLGSDSTRVVRGAWESLGCRQFACGGTLGRRVTYRWAIHLYVLLFYLFQ